MRTLLWSVAAAAGLVAATAMLDPFRNYQLATIAAYLCATAGLTVLTGLNGQLSLGHGALMAIGAYTVAFAQKSWDSLYLSLALAVVVTTVAGAVVGLAAARLRGPYLAGATLALAIAVPSITITFQSVFNSEQGLPVFLTPPRTLDIERWQALVAGGAAVLVMWLLANLSRSHLGRRMRAVRDNEVAASLTGVAVSRTQVLAFVISSACAGLGGALMAFLAQSVSPGAFPLTLSLFLLMAVVIGGLGSLAGALWGAVLLVALPDVIHSLTEGMVLKPAMASRLEGNLPLAIFGVTLIIVMLAAPGGLQGLFSRLLKRGHHAPNS
ncbi:branched-chain amino acid ABC transporter permease [Catelliglobosispora koreensis]|uniref:branched-chain amino acid ABC transporter permease n=1 Tax=Catelliglobosispora koreensis TaxID=129052 RepID=UPI0003A853F8|nr:branched-chain amino acid ABC transporter permease [Catelliglobosispora koreensis]